MNPKNLVRRMIVGLCEFVLTLLDERRCSTSYDTCTLEVLSRSIGLQPVLHGHVFHDRFSVTGRPCRIPASFPRRAASKTLELGASTWRAKQAAQVFRQNSSCFPRRYSTRTSVFVENVTGKSVTFFFLHGHEHSVMNILVMNIASPQWPHGFGT